MTPTPHGVVTALRTGPAPASEAQARIPRGPGLYAWWAPPGSLPGITGPAHPSVSDLELLYVGIATDLRQRVIGKHLRRGTGGSTLRRSLAALLADTEHLRTRWTSTRVVLVSDDEQRLTAWMRDTLQLTWCEHPHPRQAEPAVIAALRPPLNLDHNANNASYALVKTARAAWLASAGPRPPRQ